jgi:hypothetical protein
MARAWQALGPGSRERWRLDTQSAGTELVVELRRSKCTQKAKITMSSVTGNHHVLTVEWPLGDDRPKSVALAGNLE